MTVGQWLEEEGFAGLVYAVMVVVRRESPWEGKPKVTLEEVYQSPFSHLSFRFHLNNACNWYIFFTGLVRR